MWLTGSISSDILFAACTITVVSNIDTPNALMIAAVIGSLGLLLALLLAAVEVYRYYSGLRLGVREVALGGISVQSEYTYFLVLLRLAFVNPSPRGRTVYHVLVASPDNVSISTSPYQYDKGLHELIYSIPNESDELMKARVPRGDVLWLPLDIPPYQSRSGYVVIIVRVDVPKAFPPLSTHLTLTAQDVSLKCVAKFDEVIELKTHMLP